MNVEEVLSRADVVQKEYFNCKYKEPVREIISRSDEPITRKEAFIIRGMLRNSGEEKRIIFTPEPQ